MGFFTTEDTERHGTHDSQIPSVTGLNFSPESKNNLLIASKKLVAKSAQTGHSVGGAYLGFENSEGLLSSTASVSANAVSVSSVVENNRGQTQFRFAGIGFHHGRRRSPHSRGTEVVGEKRPVGFFNRKTFPSDLRAI